ncbi:MAG: hypothetical protein ACRD2A_04425, partial [Vicinamibacterales bacterium]
LGRRASSRSGRMRDARSEANRQAVRLVALTRQSADPAEAITSAAEEIDAAVVILEGGERHGVITRIRIRGMLRRIRSRLSHNRTLLVYA